MQVKLLVEGGAMKPGPALSQKIGPLGLNMGQIIQQVNDATKDFKGLKVPVELDIDAGTKEFEVNVFSPPVSELLKKELGIEKGSGTQAKSYVANASIEQIISVAKTKMQNLLCNNLKTAVKTVIGTCASLGVLVENKPAVEVGEDIDKGKFDKEIQEEKIETPEEKKKELATYFKQISSKQKAALKQEQEAAEEKTEEKAEAPKEGEEAKKDAKK